MIKIQTEILAYSECNERLIKITNRTRVRILKNLLSLGANINYINHQGYTTLMVSAEGLHDRLVEYSLKQGANPLLKNYEGQVASDLVPRNSSTYFMLKDYELLYATMINDVTAVTTLINTGAWINFQGMGGYSAIMIAVEQNSFEMVECLLLQGADLLLINAEGKSVFELTSDENILDLLLKAHNLSNVSEYTSEKNKGYIEQRALKFFKGTMSVTTNYALKSN